MTLYSNLTALDLAAKAAGSWFSEHLTTLPTVASEVAKYGQMSLGERALR